jgi:hypothetical protein
MSVDIVTSPKPMRSSYVTYVENYDIAAQYDYVMVFSMEGDDKMQPKKQTTFARQVIRTLEEAGFDAFKYLSVKEDEMIVLIRPSVIDFTQFKK